MRLPIISSDVRFFMLLDTMRFGVIKNTPETARWSCECRQTPWWGGWTCTWVSTCWEENDINLRCFPSRNAIFLPGQKLFWQQNGFFPNFWTLFRFLSFPASVVGPIFPAWTQDFGFHTLDPNKMWHFSQSMFFSQNPQPFAETCMGWSCPHTLPLRSSSLFSQLHFSSQLLPFYLVKTLGKQVLLFVPDEPVDVEAHPAHSSLLLVKSLQRQVSNQKTTETENTVWIQRRTQDVSGVVSLVISHLPSISSSYLWWNHSHKHAHTHTLTHPCHHAHTHTYTHTYTCIRTYTCTYTPLPHTHTHANTCAHTHAYAQVSLTEAVFLTDALRLCSTTFCALTWGRRRSRPQPARTRRIDRTSPSGPPVLPAR